MKWACRKYRRSMYLLNRFQFIQFLKPVGNIILHSLVVVECTCMTIDLKCAVLRWISPDLIPLKNPFKSHEVFSSLQPMFSSHLNVLIFPPPSWVDGQNKEGLEMLSDFSLNSLCPVCMYVCMYVWSSHTAEYGSFSPITGGCSEGLGAF